MEGLMSFWYGWGAFLGVFLAAAAAIYIFFDSQAAAPGRATAPRILSIAGLALTIPSLFYRLTKMDGIDVMTVSYTHLDVYKRQRRGRCRSFAGRCRRWGCGARADNPGRGR